MNLADMRRKIENGTISREEQMGLVAEIELLLKASNFVLDVLERSVKTVPTRCEFNGRGKPLIGDDND